MTIPWIVKVCFCYNAENTKKQDRKIFITKVTLVLHYLFDRSNNNQHVKIHIILRKNPDKKFSSVRYLVVYYLEGTIYVFWTCNDNSKKDITIIIPF